MNAAVALVFLAALQGSSVTPQTQRKVFVVDKVTQAGNAQVYGNTAHSQESEHHSAPVVMGEFSKRCPAVMFTKERENAEFILETQPGGSSLSNQKGDVLYLSPAKTLKNMAKDVCGYISAH